MIDKLSPKQRRIAKARIKGKSNKDIARVEYPKAKEHSGEVLVSREIQKGHVAQYIEQGKLQTLKEFNVTWRTIVEPRVEAVKAVKQNNFTGEITPDHTVRLKAAKDLEGMLENKQLDNDTRELISNLPTNADEIELVMRMKAK
jgi:hypothetical protein